MPSRKALAHRSDERIPTGDRLRCQGVTRSQYSPSYNGDENPSNVAVPPGIHAVVDMQFDLIARNFSEALNLSSALAEQRDAWLYRLLRDSVPLVHEVEKLVAVLAACALKSGWTENQVATAMGRPVSELPHWRTADAQAIAAAAAGDEPSNDWNVATGEAYLGAQSVVEEGDDARRRAYRLMCLLLLHDTPSYAADGLTWVDEKTRRCIKNGWFLQARRAATKADSAAKSPPKADAPDAAELPKVEADAKIA